MKKRFLLIILAVLLVGLLAAGCGGDKKDNQVETPAPEEKVFKIGINNFGQANFFARIGREIMMEQIEKNGGEVIATVTADVPSRIAAIENMIVQGVDAIIIQEGDISQAAPALIEAKKQGIIIASMEAGDADFVDIFVESDNAHLGRVAAEEMVKLIGGKGNIVEIFNDAGQMIRIRRQALHDVIADYPEIKIVAGFTYAWPDFFPDGKAKMEAILQAHPNPGDIAAVYATFDGVGLAAAQAIREAGLQDHIVIVGVDGDPEAYKEMQLPDSPFKATMALDPETIARTAVDMVFDMLNGKEIPNRHVYVPGKLITKDNIPQQ